MTKDDHQRINRVIARWSLLWATGAVAIVLALAFFATLYDVERRQTAHIRLNVDRVSEVLASIQGSLTRLNALGYQRCSIDPDGRFGENLLAMERERFHNSNIMAIAFVVDNQVLCSTALGVRARRFPRPAPDIVSDLGDKIWLERTLRLFGDDPEHQDQYFSVLQRGNYSAVLHRNRLLEPMIWPGQWELIADYGADKFSLAGNADLSHLPKSTGLLSLSGISSQACGGSVGLHCVAVHSSLTDIWQHYRYYIPVLLALMLWAAFTANLLTRRRLGNHYSAKNRVRRAFNNGDGFYCVYQAMVDLRTGQNVGCEITCRFEDEFGQIPRDDFIGVIRELGITWQWTETMLKQSLAEIARYDDWAHRFRVSFNVYPEDLCSGEALRLVQLQDVKHERFRYVLEVREDALLDEEAAIDNLATLDAAGFWMAMDHFGTGYSNVRMLAAAQCRWVKIDKSFVADIGNRSLRSTLIPGIVGMAHSRNIAVVALGVDTPPQIEALLEAEVVWGQGEALGRAVDIETFHAQTVQAAEHLIGHEDGEAPRHLV